MDAVLTAELELPLTLRQSKAWIKRVLILFHEILRHHYSRVKELNFSCLNRTHAASKHDNVFALNASFLVSSIQRVGPLRLCGLLGTNLRVTYSVFVHDPWLINQPSPTENSEVWIKIS